MGSVGEGAAVQVVDQSTVALVAALAAAEDHADILVTGIVNGLNSLQEVLGSPGMGILIDVLHCTGLLEDGLVDGHAVSGHAQGVLVVGTAFSLTSGGNRSIGVGQDIGGPQVAQVNHLTLGAPVGDQALGSFHNQIRSGIAFDGSIDLVVSILVGQVFHGNLDVGISGIELGEQALNSSLIAPLANGVGPQADFGGSGRSLGGSLRSGSLGSGRGRSGGGGFSLLHGAGSHAQNQDHSQSQSNQFLHCTSSY